MLLLRHAYKALLNEGRGLRLIEPIIYG